MFFFSEFLQKHICYSSVSEGPRRGAGTGTETSTEHDSSGKKIVFYFYLTFKFYLAST